MQGLTCLNYQLKAGGIAQITLNRPDKLNALNATLLQELQMVVAKMKIDPAVRGVILTGSGAKAFCAGADINQLAEVNAETGLQFARMGQSVFRSLETMGKPSIAAINGYAFGGGCELAMAATLRIASDNAVFSQPEVKLGVIPGYGGTQRLARLVGKGRAMEMCLTGRNVSAEQALAWGLVNDKTSQEQLLPKAEEFLLSILNQAPLSVRSVMVVIDQGYDLSLTDALELEAVHFALTCASEDKKEGTSAFLQKRSAEFKGQ